MERYQSDKENIRLQKGKSIIKMISKIFLRRKRTHETTEVAEKYSVSSKRIFFERDKGKTAVPVG